MELNTYVDNENYYYLSWKDKNRKFTIRFDNNYCEWSYLDNKFNWFNDFISPSILEEMYNKIGILLDKKEK